MQPENHEAIFQKLASATNHVKSAVKEMDLDMLMTLAKDHQHVVRALDDAGICKDARLLDMIQSLFAQVNDVIAEIRYAQHDISTRMKQVSNGKKLMQAYKK